MDDCVGEQRAGWDRAGAGVSTGRDSDGCDDAGDGWADDLSQYATDSGDCGDSGAPFDGQGAWRGPAALCRAGRGGGAVQAVRSADVGAADRGHTGLEGLAARETGQRGIQVKGKSNDKADGYGDGPFHSCLMGTQPGPDSEPPATAG